MNRGLTFYVERNSPLHRLNPLTKLTLVLTILAIDFLGPWYWLPVCIFLFIAIPASIWGKMGREFFRALLRLLIPAVVFLFIMQCFFYPGGRDVIFHIWFLKVTKEAVQAGFLISTRVLAMVSAFILLLLSTHPSTLISDLVARGVPGVLAYVLTSTLQIVPQMRQKAAVIMDAQKSRGLKTEGSLRTRVLALLPLVRPLVFGSLIDVEERTIAIEARGFTSPAKKTSLLEIDDPSWEQTARVALLLICAAMIGSRLWLLLR